MQKLISQLRRKSSESANNPEEIKNWIRTHNIKVNGDKQLIIKNIAEGTGDVELNLSKESTIIRVERDIQKAQVITSTVRAMRVMGELRNVIFEFSSMLAAFGYVIIPISERIAHDPNILFVSDAVDKATNGAMIIMGASWLFLHAMRNFGKVTGGLERVRKGTSKHKEYCQARRIGISTSQPVKRRTLLRIYKACFVLFLTKWRPEWEGTKLEIIIQTGE